MALHLENRQKGAEIKQAPASARFLIDRELTPSPFPLPFGERIKVRGKRGLILFKNRGQAPHDVFKKLFTLTV